MNQVVSVQLENNPQYGVVVSSRKVAEGLGKKHYHVMRDLDQILENSNLSSLENPDLDFLKNSDIKANIIPATYTVANQKRKYREYLLTKDGFTLYMFNIQGYNDFKWAYIQKFNEMEAELAKVSKPVQQQLPMEKPMPVRKTFRGVPVMTTKDVAQVMHCRQTDARYWATQCNPCGRVLEEDDLDVFKRENGIRSTASKMVVLYRYQVEDILDMAGASEDMLNAVNAYFGQASQLEREDMRCAVMQADLLYKIAKNIKDPVVKEMNFKAVTALLIDVGLWNNKESGFNGVTANWDINTREGWNKLTTLQEAKKCWL